MTFVNTKILNKLDDATKAVIMTAAANAEKEGWALGRKLAKKHTDILADKGIKVAAPTETLTNELKAIGATMLTEWLAEAGDSGKALISAYNK